MTTTMPPTTQYTTPPVGEPCDFTHPLKEHPYFCNKYYEVSKIVPIWKKINSLMFYLE